MDGGGEDLDLDPDDWPKAMRVCQCRHCGRRLLAPDELSKRLSGEIVGRRRPTTRWLYADVDSPPGHKVPVCLVCVKRGEVLS